MWTAAQPCGPEAAQWPEATRLDGPLDLKPGEVHVWLCELQTTREPEWAGALLGPAERARAAALRAAPLRRAYVAAQGALRSILAAYAGADPRQLQFHRNAWGKPALAAGGPHFNLSHSGDVALLAVSAGGPVGIDIEAMMPEAPVTIAPLAFTKAERALLAAAGPARRETFYGLWTRKEALAKGIGCGLSVDPRAMDVSGNIRDAGCPARLARELASAGTWHLFALPTVASCIAALATQDCRPTLILKRMTDNTDWP